MNGSRIVKYLGNVGNIHPSFATFCLLARDYIIYFAGAIAIGLGNFILVPLYTRSLTAQEFGVYAIIDVTILLLVLVTQLGFGVSYLKWFANIELSQRGELLGSSLILSISAAFIGGLGLASITAFNGAQWLQINQTSFAWMLLPIVMLENVQGLFLNDLRARQKAFLYATAAVVRLITIVTASLWCISILDMGLNGVFLGRLIGDAVGVVLLAIMCLRSVQIHFSLSLAWTMIGYGIPLVWGGLMALLMDAAGRYFLNHYSSIEEVGFYSVAIKISSIFQILISQPFGLAWGGMMFRIVRRPDARAIYSRIIVYMVLVTSVAAFILSLFSPTLLAIFATNDYAPALIILPIILLVRAVNVLEYPTSLGIHLKGRTRLFMVSHTIGLIVCIVANIILVPQYGMLGASWAWFFGWLAVILLMAFIGQYFYPLEFNWWILGWSIVLWVVFGLILQLPSVSISTFSLIWRIGAITLVVIGAVMLLLYDMRSMSKMNSLDVR